MTKPGRNKGAPTDDALFKAAMTDARPLRRKPARRANDPPAPETPPDRQTARGETKPPPPATAPPPPPPAASLAGLDRRSAERLRRGQMKIEARLDLHGHTQADAHRALHAFVDGSHRAGRRCLLVITGKGGPRESEDASFMPDRQSGVLRRNLPRWLAEPAVRHMVLGLQPAQPKHGGEGAYYLLLRRRR
ncbi:MAG: Smr/MutS family protein [Alphaproteobacteria bacterium]|jgi:DNA-nicking Smr family endonuclease|nr:Smr/MutS family protein [Alphaproteobacteria bacterium]MDP6815058.1 Smr/MutS family protein [Alphaproteobacteria bacterium]